MDENYQKLANAIILQAVKDFRAAYRRLKRFPNDRAAQSQVRDITKFFCSQYFSALTTLDGPSLLQKIIDEFRATLNRKYEVAEEFDKIYRYLLRRLLEANATKDVEIMKEVVEHLRSMRDNWKEVMKKVKEEREGAV